MHTIQRRSGVLIIAGLVAAVELLSVPGRQMWARTLQDAAHGPVFAIIAVVLALMQRPPSGAPMRWLALSRRAWSGAVAIGALTELVQVFLPGRTASLADVMRDAAGAALGLALLAIVDHRRSPDAMPTVRPAANHAIQVRRWGYAAALIALIVLAWAPLECVVAYGRRAANFPTLAEGTHPGDLYFLSGHHAEVDRAPLPAPFRRAEDGSALRVSYEGPRRLRFEIFEPMPDWRGYDVLAIDLTNPGAQPLPLVLKVQDAEHNLQTDDRLNLGLVVPAATRTTVRVALSVVASAPKSRRMDLSRMANVALYTPTHPTEPGVFYVSRIWLE